MGVAFLLTTLVIVVTPGPGLLYTVAAAISRGRRASLIAAAGCTLGIIPHLVAAITGLAALLYASSLAFQTLKYVGVAYLFFLAWKAYRDDSHIVVDETAEIETPASAWSVIVRGVLISLLNPKLTIFFFAFLPQFVRPDEPDAVLRMLGLGSVFMLVTLLVFAGYGAFAARVRSLVLGRPRTVVWMRRTFAGAYVDPEN
jgi:threonine/homoserine/homoserine lactone efflux protein